MKKLILITFGFFALITLLSSTIVTHAADKPAPAPATLESFNPFASGGIKCLYSFSQTTANKKANVSDPAIGKGSTGQCTKETGLLNRVESLMFILAPSFAVLGIMLGGYKMMQDGYDSKGEGMKTIRGSIIGLVIVLSAFFVRNLVYTFFNDTFTATDLTINNEVVQVVVKLLRQIAYEFLIPIGSPIAVGFVIWGGYQLVTAGGDTKKIDSGTKTIRNAIIGFLIIVFAAALVSIAQNLLGSFYGTLNTK
jgi:Type IV secretion system pilin